MKTDTRQQADKIVEALFNDLRLKIDGVGIWQSLPPLFNYETPKRWREIVKEILDEQR